MISVVAAQPEHLPALVDLLRELDEYYGASDKTPSEQTFTQVSDLLFTAQPAAYVLLASYKLSPAAFAAYSFLWPAAGVSRSLYLKELFVRERFRGLGVGHALMREICEIALATNCSRVEWTTDQDNLGAQEFYERLGYRANSAKIFYRIEVGDIGS